MQKCTFGNFSTMIRYLWVTFCQDLVPPMQSNSLHPFYWLKNPLKGRHCLLCGTWGLDFGSQVWSMLMAVDPNLGGWFFESSMKRLGPLAAFVIIFASRSRMVLEKDGKPFKKYICQFTAKNCIWAILEILKKSIATDFEFVPYP